VLVWAFTIAIVAGVIEEAGFRGYLQGPLERRYGGAIAIGAASSLFAVLHLPQARVNLPIFSTILVASLIVGTLAFASDSIVPGILAHATIDIVAVPLRLTGRLPPPPLAETGVDAFLVLTFLGVAAGAVGTALSFRRLLGSSPERPGVAAL